MSHLHVAFNPILLGHLNLLVHEQLTLIWECFIALDHIVLILMLLADAFLIDVKKVDQVVQNLDTGLIKVRQELFVAVDHLFDDGGYCRA